MNMNDVDQDRLIRLRLEGAKRVCERLDVAALIGTQHDNVQYFSDVRRFFVYGWEPNSIALVTRDGETKHVDCGAHVAPGPHWRDEGAELKKETGWDHFTVFNANLITERYAKWIADGLRDLGVTKGKVGIDRVSWILLDAFKAEMPDIEFVNAELELLLERAIKNEEEQKVMRFAGWVAAQGVEAGIAACKPGATEFEVSGAFMGKLYELGSEGDGFYPFLASGKVREGTLYPTNRTLEEGDPVVIDMGPILGGYNGDCMRSTFVGGDPTPEFKELYKLNYDAMYAGIEATKPGVRISEVDAAVRALVDKHGGYMNDRFDTGHGIGLNCCELPVCMKAGVAPDHLDLVLEPGMCFTLEPRYFKMLDDSSYIQTALEETVMVTDDGVEVLTPASYLEDCLK